MLERLEEIKKQGLEKINSAKSSKELEEISVVTNEGKDIILLENGRFVLPGTEVLNEPLDEAGF